MITLNRKGCSRDILPVGEDFIGVGEGSDCGGEGGGGGLREGSTAWILEVWRAR